MGRCGYGLYGRFKKKRTKNRITYRNPSATDEDKTENFFFRTWEQIARETFAAATFDGHMQRWVKWDEWICLLHAFDNKVLSCLHSLSARTLPFACIFFLWLWLRALSPFAAGDLGAIREKKKLLCMPKTRCLYVSFKAKKENFRPMMSVALSFSFDIVPWGTWARKEKSFHCRNESSPILMPPPTSPTPNTDVFIRIEN